MKIVVTVKVIPEKIKFDRETKRIDRSGVKMVLNPTDLIAAEEASKFRESGDKLIAVSMGPPSAKTTLDELFKYGFDEVYLLSDMKFAGSDTLATAYALSAGIKKIVPDFDIIFQGDYSVDGATGQIPGELAAFLGIPFLTHIKTVTRKEVTRKTEETLEHFTYETPILFSVSDDANFGISPNLFYLKNAENKQTEILNAEAIGADPEQCGLKGSKTSVLSVIQNEIKNSGNLIEENGAEEIVKLLKKVGIL